MIVVSKVSVLYIYPHSFSSWHLTASVCICNKTSSSRWEFFRAPLRDAAPKNFPPTVSGIINYMNGGSQVSWRKWMKVNIKVIRFARDNKAGDEYFTEFWSLVPWRSRNIFHNNLKAFFHLKFHHCLTLYGSNFRLRK